VARAGALIEVTFYAATECSLDFPFRLGSRNAALLRVFERGQSPGFLGFIFEQDSESASRNVMKYSAPSIFTWGR
jgi:hypothetical protein